ncbi:hypothetical protein F5Y10DRAFT_159979 [Nemania abortiva]|nr:hypothetical protein F5Y10DRAFT_159979 [Nemania abortiva]
MVSILDFPNLSPAEQEAILNGPGMVPPEGVTPDFSRPGNRPDVAIAVSVVCLTLVTLVVSIRAYSRLFIVKSMRLEDYLGIAAIGGYGGVVWAYYTQLYYGGFFVHQYDIRFRDLQKVLYTGILLTIVYAITMVFAKTAILLEWIHLFVPNREDRVFYWGARILIALNIIFYAAGIPSEALQCIPLSSIWEPWITDKTCIDSRALNLTAAYFNLVVDIFILVLPQRVIWNLHMAKHRKIDVSIIFSLGILSIVCAIGRIYGSHQFSYVEEGDTNYSLTNLYLWALPEVSCVLLVHNVTAIPKVLHETWLGARIAATFRYCAHITNPKRLTEDRTTPKIWPLTSDDDHFSTHHMVSGSNHVQLADLKSTRPMGHDTMYKKSAETVNGGIMRHTEFEVHEDIIPQGSDASSSTDISRQHPWATRR